MNVSFHCPDYPRLRGSALLVTLCIITVVSVSMLIFMSRALFVRQLSTSDTANIQAEYLAKSAVEILSGDLRQEMVAGSEKVWTAPQPNTPDIMEVRDPVAMRPSRVVKSEAASLDNFRTLIRQSAAGHSAFEINGKSGVLRSSGENTGISRAKDGRIIAPTRWDKPLLTSMPLNSEALAPDWIYVTRANSFPTSFDQGLKQPFLADGTPNPDFVVGRFAYNIYDISGMLNANTAGFVSTVPSADLAGKGALLFADLSEISGMESVSHTLPEWRTSVGWTDRITSETASPLRLVQSGRETGWRRVTHASDNAFVSRQDLLKWLENQAGISDLRGAASALTHFNVAVNAPSWGPPNIGTPSYEANANTNGIANRFIPAVRNSSTGRPLYENRFDLNQLDAFSNPAGNAAKIKTAFGLERAVDGFRWVYRGQTGSIATIRTPDQVAAAGDVPDFFETLKAAILNGSLGISTPQNSALANKTDDESKDRQIFRIGANIIDQWDADNDPTVIIFDPASSASDVFGVENLPYLGWLTFDVCQETGTQNALIFNRFELWNPHRNANQADAGEYRIAVWGEPRALIVRNDGSGDRFGNPVPYFGAGNTPAPLITFSTSSENFETPKLLRNGVASAQVSPDYPHCFYPQANLMGILVGNVDMGTPTNNGVTFTLSNTKFAPYVYNQPLTIYLQKNIKGNASAPDNFQTYAVWKRYEGRFPYAHAVVADNGFLYSTSGAYRNVNFALGDVRSTRLGTWGAASSNWTGHPRNSTGLPPAEQSLYNLMAGGVGRIFPYTVAQSYTSEGFQFSGTDGILRKGDTPTDNPYVMTNRPIMLDRRFRSVGEMAYAFRDDPMRSLTFSDDNGADGGLLDFFTLTPAPIREDMVSLNAAHPTVLASLLKGVTLDEISGTLLSDTGIIRKIAENMRDFLDIHPQKNPGDLPRLGTLAKDDIAGSSASKIQRESISRAMADLNNTRTWNIMIDVIAQSGLLTSNASSLADFQVRGEKRYWAFLAIDRITGEIVDKRIEPVTE